MYHNRVVGAVGGRERGQIPTARTTHGRVRLTEHADGTCWKGEYRREEQVTRDSRRHLDAGVVRRGMSPRRASRNGPDAVYRLQALRTVADFLPTREAIWWSSSVSSRWFIFRFDVEHGRRSASSYRVYHTYQLVASRLGLGGSPLTSSCMCIE
ncbi:hypothetical protein FRC08_016102 [Ceratobasidium sp. 394]|nr:hypothetical protein FRC08_016102 [Ceratobasidium sp. 394]